MASFSGLDEPFAGGVVVLGYCLLLARAAQQRSKEELYGAQEWKQSNDKRRKLRQHVCSSGAVVAEIGGCCEMLLENAGDLPAGRPQHRLG